MNSLANPVLTLRLPVWRSQVVLLALLLWFIGLGARAVYLQGMHNDFLQQKGDARYSRVIEISAHRGMITDRNGEPFAISTPVESVWASPADVEITPEKLKQGFGKTWTIVDPGVSIKPYPSGIVTHQSMDAMLALVLKHDLKPEQVAKIRFFAGKNILEPIRYPLAKNHLQAKFSMPALLAMIILKRRASHHEFMDSFVAGAAMQDMQKRTELINDAEIDAKGWDLIRSRIEVETKAGAKLVQWADERYRGGPLNPISDADLEGKFRMCAEGAIEKVAQDRLLDTVRGLDKVADASVLADLMVHEAKAGSH